MPLLLTLPLITQGLSTHNELLFSLPIMPLILIAIVVILVLLAIFSSPIGSRKNKAKRNTLFK